MKKKPSILYLVQLPPPVHGVSLINQQVCRSKILNEDLRKSILEIRFSKSFDQIRKFSGKKLLIFFSLFFRLFIRLVSHRPDYVYFSMMPFGKGFLRDFPLVLLIKTFRSRLILHLHNCGIHRHAGKTSMKMFFRFAYSNIDIIHLSGSMIAKEFIGLGLKKTRFHVVPNGIDLKGSDEHRTRGEGKNITLLFLSNLMTEKGVFLAVEAFKSLVKNSKDLFLTIAGAPYNKNENRLKKILESDEILRSRVKYFGPVLGEMKYRLFTQADIFVFPSYFREECFPLVLLEAMAAGLPVVASSVGAVDKIIKHEENGFLIRPGDKKELITRLEELVKDKDLRERMGYKSLQLYREKYTSAKFEENMLEIFNEIIFSKS